MKWFYDLKIAAKLIAGFIMVALIAGIIGYMGITKINLIDQADTELYKNNTRPLADIGQVAKSFQRIRVNLRDIIIEKDNSDCQKYADTIKELNQGIDKLLPSYEKGLSSSEERQQFANLQESLTKFEPVQAKIIELALAHKESEALALMRGEGLIQAQAIEQSIDKLMEINTAQASATADSNTAAAQAAKSTMIILIVIGVLMALALGFFISRIISNPVRKLVDAADKLALGDVNVQVEANSKDEIGTLAKSFAAMVENIRSQALVAEKIAAGDMSVQVNVRSQDDLLGIKLSEMLENLKMIISEMNLMYEEQKAGDIDVYIPIDKFSGAYRQMTDGVNQMVKLHVDVILKVLGVITSYAEGDFTPVLEKLPGKQVIANEKLDLIRNNLLNLINEILTLTKAATTGQLSTRADASKYSGDYARIVQGINNILDAIVAPLQDTIAVLNEMAQGNLCTGITSDLQGDYAKIKNAVNDTLQAFNEVLGQINEAAGQVASGSGQVSSSSQALSQASTEQASSVEEITATMTQISAQTKQNALNANQANELATNAKENAVKGNQEMQEMLKSMGEINDASANISKIIKVIDEIAFQTNILALNAAVEAARAGQHGKGFAVVAEEVRNLAARSANAAKETTVMIEGSIDKVELGTRMANETAGALNKIVEGVTTVADLVGDIAGASNEQATAIAQVNQGIAGVAEVTQMNTATAQQSAAASEELASQAELLKDQVNRFKLQKAGTSMHNLNEMSPDIIRMIENMIEKKQPVHTESHEGMRKEAAPRPKAQITLDDSDFGKY